MNLGEYDRCRCRKYGNAHELCDDELTFSEAGKKARLVLRQGEQAVAITLDGCVFQDNKLKCDGLFLWCGRNRKTALLVELKGAHEIAHAFEQLAYVQQSRQAYQTLLASVDAMPGAATVEKAVIVSNGMLSKPKQERLENEHGIRVSAVVHCEATSPVPDLHEYL